MGKFSTNSTPPPGRNRDNRPHLPPGGVGAAFPRWAEAARRAAEQGRRPVADAGVVRELLDGFGRWAEDTLDQAVMEARNLDGRAR